MVIDPECPLFGEEMSFVVEELKEEKGSQLKFSYLFLYLVC